MVIIIALLCPKVFRFGGILNVRQKLHSHVTAASSANNLPRHSDWIMFILVKLEYKRNRKQHPVY